MSMREEGRVRSEANVTGQEMGESAPAIRDREIRCICNKRVGRACRHVSDRRLGWIMVWPIDDCRMKPHDRSLAFVSSRARIHRAIYAIAKKISKESFGSQVVQFANFFLRNLTFWKKCDKGREIAISALTPDKITHRRVCTRICYTNMKRYASSFDNSRNCIIQFCDS